MRLRRRQPTQPQTATIGLPDSHEEDGYHGPATLHLGGEQVSVEVVLGGYFQPLEGRYAWYGRVAGDETLAALVHGSTACLLETPQGTATAIVGDPDLWGRLRVTGSSTPPFTVITSIADADADAH